MYGLLRLSLVTVDVVQTAEIELKNQINESPNLNKLFTFFTSVLETFDFDFDFELNQMTDFLIKMLLLKNRIN